MPTEIEVSTAGRTREIRLNRAHKRNALTAAMYQELAAALRAAEADESISAVLISGAGAGFCAGNDLPDFLANPPEGTNSPVGQFLTAISTLTVPVVAAVQGAAVGVGATMLLHCDHVVADETAKLHFAFVPLGLVPEAASSMLLPRAVGQLAAARLLLLAEPVLAPAALGLGLVSEVVPAGTQLEAARAVTDRLGAQPPGALRLTKRLLRADPDTVAGRMAEEGALFAKQLKGPEFTAAVTAFLQRS
ncbi:MAG TPA: enoyl-CoA hydratase-related protein [Pseudonocardia sp.]|jgi:enoyl-CoA hydratase/carnithine racemase